MNACVFCGSSLGDNPVFHDTAESLGTSFARTGITLVYGGGNIGLMGVLANAVMRGGGEVIGIIPEFLMKREVGHRGITHLEVVRSMHERKRRMAELADVFVALPGGWGTLEELAEILTWNQLGLITRPVYLLNCDGFYDALVDQMSTMVSHGFLSREGFSLISIVDSPSELIRRLRR
jgi:uncharacterized protein (TIGR00730 family)